MEKWGVFVKRRKCKNCRKSLAITASHPEQTYCSKKECQKARKNKWQRRKLSSDEDYRKNQADCREQWVEKHPGYWKQYRAKHPESTRRNRAKQSERNRINRKKPPAGSKLSSIAKMAAKPRQKPLISGYYELTPIAEPPFVKMAPIIVKIDEAVNPGVFL